MNKDRKIETNRLSNALGKYKDKTYSSHKIWELRTFRTQKKQKEFHFRPTKKLHTKREYNPNILCGK